jgi:hypothetical protein
VVFLDTKNPDRRDLWFSALIAHMPHQTLINCLMWGSFSVLG